MESGDFEVEFPEEVDNMMNKNYYVLLVLTQEFFCLSILTEGSDWYWSVVLRDSILFLPVCNNYTVYLWADVIVTRENLLILLSWNAVIE